MSSLYKLWLVGDAYNQLNQNKISENDILSSDIGELKAKYGINTSYAQYSIGFLLKKL